MVSTRSSAQAYWVLVEIGQPQPIRTQRAPAGTSTGPVVRDAQLAEPLMSTVCSADPEPLLELPRPALLPVR